MEKEESIKDYKEPLNDGSGRSRTIIHSRPWNDDDDDSNAYFMSEPSVSEAESSEYVRNFPSLLAPRAESPSSTSSRDLLPAARSPPPAPQPQPQQNRAAAAHLLSYPISPGTSISSWDSPHLFRKQVRLYFSPDRPSNNLEAAKTTRGNQSTSSEGSAIVRRQPSDEFLKDLKQNSIGAVKDARPEDFDSDRSQQQLNGADRTKVDAVIRNAPVRNNALGAVLAQVESNDQDETIIMDLSASDEDEGTKTTEEPLDWEAKHSADDEKTEGERPKRAKRPGSGHRRSKSGDGSGHRRTRSGDEAAAFLMTGGKGWKGMQIDQLPIPSEHDDEDENDHSHDSEDVHRGPIGPQQQENGSPLSKRINHVRSESTGGFAVGSGKNLRLTTKKPRRNQRVRRPVHCEMDRQETDSTLEEEQERMSRDTFSRYALESPRALPKYVGRASPTNESMSTIYHFTPSDRIESDSSGHGGGARRHVRAGSDVNFSIPNRHQRTLSDADLFQPSLQHRVSEITFDSSRGHGSPFSLLSSKHEPRLSGSWDPRYPYEYNAYQFGDVPERLNREGGYQFGNAEEETPDDTSNDYSRSDYSSEDEERDIQSNRLRYAPDMKLDELERLLEDGGMRGKAQHVLRHRLSPFQNFGKDTPSSTKSRASYKPISENDGNYPTFVCPVCKTRQREFFTAASAPSQFQGPTGFLALYFAIYVIASLFIFGLKEGWKPLDCVYFAVITLTTAGLGDFTPTSDGAKVMCSVFIYFGVATIGLLLGSYLASMLDDKSYKQAQRNRVENCPNCIRMKNLRTLQLRRAKQTQRSNQNRQNSIRSQKAALGFMSERYPNDRSHLGPHVLEAREQKRVRTHKSPESHVKSSKEPKPSENVKQKADKTDSSGVEVKVQQSGVSTSEKDTGKAAPSSSDDREKSKSPDEVKPGLDVINSVRKAGASNVVLTPELTPASPQMSEASPGSMLGSPLTSDILGRQSHTRHMSFVAHDLNYGSTSSQFRRQRKYSEDLIRSPHFPEAIPENVPVENQSPNSWSQQNPIAENESEYESDEESTESETSTESDATLDEARRRIKTAKYVLLTLKQALMNSVLIIMIGGIGFYMIEEMSAVDSFYFTTVLLTTVGYGDIVPVTSAGKLFATIYVLVAGTVLLHNMSMISFIPLELRKRRIEQAVLTQFGDQLDDVALRELATGPLMQNLQLSTHSTTGLEECTREMFALAMLVRLGKVSETDIKQTFRAFRRLDVDNDGMLTTKSIIAGMVHKHRSTHGSTNNLRKAGEIPSEPPLTQQPPPPPPPPPPFVDPGAQQVHASSPLRFGNRASPHLPTDRDSFRFARPAPGESEQSFLMRNSTGYDSFSGQPQAFGPDVEEGYAPKVYQYGEESRRVAE